jgi:hypothetical protein
MGLPSADHGSSSSSSSSRHSTQQNVGAGTGCFKEQVVVDVQLMTLSHTGVLEGIVGCNIVDIVLLEHARPGQPLQWGLRHGIDGMHDV